MEWPAHWHVWRRRYLQFSIKQAHDRGEGGIIITNDDAFERLARSVHDCGRMPDEWFYSHCINGSNYRLSPTIYSPKSPALLHRDSARAAHAMGNTPISFTSIQNSSLAFPLNA